MYRAVFILLPMTLIGCVSPQQRAAQQQAQLAQVQAADDNTCRSYGLTFGTLGYAQCRENIDNQRVEEEQEAQARRAAIAEAYLSSHPAYQAPVQPQYYLPTNQTVQTNCQTYGTQTNCTSR